MTDTELLDEILCDELVEHCRFGCNEHGQADTCVVTYKDGSTGILIADGRQGWHFAAGGPPHDAATATGMYD